MAERQGGGWKPKQSAGPRAPVAWHKIYRRASRPDRGATPRGHKGPTGVVGILDPGKLRVLGGGTDVGDTAERCLHLLVGPLRLSIGLGDEPGGKARCGP